MRAALRAGIAIFNDGEYHLAHDAWEDAWLALERDTPDERFLHGLIQYTAAVHHAHDANPTGATGLATRARRYLAGLPETYRGVALVPLRATLRAIAVDPRVVCRRPLPPMLHQGVAVALEDLDPPETAIVARVLAESTNEWSTATIDAATDRAERGSVDNRFAALLTDFVRERARRGLVYGILERQVDREAGKDADVDGLFPGDQSS